MYIKKIIQLVQFFLRCLVRMFPDKADLISRRSNTSPCTTYALHYCSEKLCDSDTPSYEQHTTILPFPHQRASACCYIRKCKTSILVLVTFTSAFLLRVHFVFIILSQFSNILNIFITGNHCKLQRSDDISNRLGESSRESV